MQSSRHSMLFDRIIFRAPPLDALLQVRHGAQLLADIGALRPPTLARVGETRGAHPPPDRGTAKPGSAEGLRTWFRGFTRQ